MTHKLNRLTALVLALVMVFAAAFEELCSDPPVCPNI